MQPKVLDIVQKAFWKYHDERSIAWYTIGTLDGTFPPKSDQGWKCELYPKNTKRTNYHKNDERIFSNQPQNWKSYHVFDQQINLLFLKSSV